MEYKETKEKIKEINQDIFSLIQKAKKLTFVSKDSFEDWERVCKDIERQLSDDIFRIAIVGAIKSGKSTLANFLFCGDYLKRGAGIVTSFLTKVRKGKELKAEVYIKPLSEINKEIEQAIMTLSSYEEGLKRFIPFDIRDELKRNRLEEVVKGFDPRFFVKDGTQDINYLTVLLYLKGYRTVKDLISEKQKKVVYKGKEFSKHKEFVGNDSLAIYLKDISVEINRGIFDESVELADCQGSDSPNPRHIVMIQEYLTKTQLVIYVISSRMGIREADMKFLDMLKRMGLLERTVFLLNCDFDEHRSKEDLLSLVEKTKEEISVFVTEPKLFSFSALYNLLNQTKKITERERMRLLQWKTDKELIEFSEKQTAEFLSYLHDLLSKQRYEMFLKSWMSHISFVLSEMKEWTSLNIKLMQSSTSDAESMIKKIRTDRERLSEMGVHLSSVLSGIADRVKERMRKKIDSFFDRDGRLLKILFQFMNSFQIPYVRYVELLENMNLREAQYVVFKEYKKSVDQFISQNINPLIVRFVKQIESEVLNEILSAVKPYYEIKEPVKVDFIKKRYSLTAPSISAIMEYNISLTTETLVRFGIYKALGFIKGLLKKKESSDIEEKIKALESTLSRIKKKGIETISFCITNYKENLKYQYVFKLITCICKYIEEVIMIQLKKSLERFSDIEREIKREKDEKEVILGNLKEIEKELISYMEKLGNSGNFIHFVK